MEGDMNISRGAESGRKWERERERRGAAGETKESFVLLFCSRSLRTSQRTPTAAFEALNHGRKSQAWSQAEEPGQRLSHL